MRSVRPALLAACLGACLACAPRSGDVRSVAVGEGRVDMVYVPAGEFLMGSSGGWEDERPAHRVRITRGFWLGRTEVTQGLWRRVMGNNPAAFPGGDAFPVEQVSWNDCLEFISRLNRLTGKAFRLPSEAEWEYACRAGSAEDRPADLDASAWYDRNSGQSTHAVGRKRANALGLHDMLGNVWEWCADGYDSSFYSRSPLEDPVAPRIGIHRVDRGGCWGHGPDIVRPSRRDGSGDDYRVDLIGLRLAASKL